MREQSASCVCYGEDETGGGGSVSTIGRERFFSSLRASLLPLLVDSFGTTVGDGVGKGGLGAGFGDFGGGAGAADCDGDDGISRSI